MIKRSWWLFYPRMIPMCDPGLFDLQAYQTFWRGEIDDNLDCFLDELTGCGGCPFHLGEAIKYAVLEGGKRLRPLLCLASVRSVGGCESEAVKPACSLEFVHAYSLVHDDLPAMDDDDYRRGKPSCHKKYGEAVAILAGDALLTYAFEILARFMDPERLGQALVLLAQSSGACGMVGGQADDVILDSPDWDVAWVESVHTRKTGAMFEASVRLGGLIGRASDWEMRALSVYGKAMGLAFQVVDDVLDFRGDGEILGKPTGSDAAQGRRTHPMAVGLSGSIKRVKDLLLEATEALADLGAQADALRAFIGLIGQRIE